MDSKLVLEYIRVLIWPLLTLLLLLAFRGQISDVLTTGTFNADIFGVSIKSTSEGSLTSLKSRETELTQNIDTLNQALKQQQLNYNELMEQYMVLEKQLEKKDASASGDVRPDVASRSADDPVLKEASQVRKELEKKNQELYTQILSKVDDSRRIVQGSRADKAASMEKEAFDLLWNGQYEQAAKRFEEVESVYPKYHNAYEIGVLLRTSLDDLTDDARAEQARRDVLAQILKEHHWGMPADVRKRIEQYLKEQ